MVSAMKSAAIKIDNIGNIGDNIDNIVWMFSKISLP